MAEPRQNARHVTETRGAPCESCHTRRGRPTIRNSPCNMKATGCQHCDSGKCVPYQLIAGVDTRNHSVMRRVRIVAGSAAPGQPAAPSSPPAAASVHYTGPATAFPEPDAGMHRTEEDVTAFMNHLKIKQLPPSPKIWEQDLAKWQSAHDQIMFRYYEEQLEQSKSALGPWFETQLAGWCRWYKRSDAPYQLQTFATLKAHDGNDHTGLVAFPLAHDHAKGHVTLLNDDHSHRATWMLPQAGQLWRPAH